MIKQQQNQNNVQSQSLQIQIIFFILERNFIEEQFVADNYSIDFQDEQRMIEASIFHYESSNFNVERGQSTIQRTQNQTGIKQELWLLNKLWQQQHNDTLYLVKKIRNKQQVQSFLDELICPICYEVIADPLICKSCEKSFCDLFIKNWKKQYQQGCPCCRQYIFKVKPSKFQNIFLNKLIFSCINEEKGCNQQSSYSELKDHIIQCDYQIQRCSQRKCPATFLQKDKKQHLMQCPYENVQCKGCLKYFKRKDLDFHQGTCNYLFKYQFCNIKLLLEEYKLHIHQCEEKIKNNNKLFKTWKNQRNLINIKRNRNQLNNLTANQFIIKKINITIVENIHYINIQKYCLLFQKQSLI